MNTIVNKQGEQITTWKSHKHPNNSNFMQLVKFMHVKKSTGENVLYYSLCNASVNDIHIIFDITLSNAKLLYCDNVENMEDEFQNWLKNNI